MICYECVCGYLISDTHKAYSMLDFNCPRCSLPQSFSEPVVINDLSPIQEGEDLKEGCND